MEHGPIRAERQIKPEALELKAVIETLRAAIHAAERDDTEALQLIRQIEDPEKLAKLYDEHRARITESADTARTALKKLEEDPANFEANKKAVEEAVQALLLARGQIQPDPEPKDEKPVTDTNAKRYV